MTYKIALITNIPAPYREAIHQQVAEYFHGNYTVIYCHEKEPNRDWRLNERKYPSIILQSNMLAYKGRYIHFNADIFKKLNRLSPDVIITTGFNPTMLFAFAWAKAKGKKHIAMTDGWLGSESHLSWAHRLVRKLVYHFSSAYIGASKHSLDLYRHYRCKENALFQSQLCANNIAFESYRHTPKKYDLMFSGQFIEGKMPLFFAEVAHKVKLLKGSCSVLVLGSGPMEAILLKQLNEYGIDIHFPGFVTQEELPAYYAAARLLLFPTLQDAWGVVANEACAAGTPVITCDNAGVAHDLIQHNKNGFILPLDSKIWSEHAMTLLNDHALYKQFATQAISDVEHFTYQQAAQGIIDAINYSLGNQTEPY